MDAPQYTWCVAREDYADPDLPTDFWSLLGQCLISGGLLGVLSRICDYLMGGKLICIGGYECAIGRVAEFDTVDNKTSYEKVDNDFSINIVLAPNDLELFAAQSSRLAAYDLAAKDGSPANGLQGYLIREQVPPGMPEPFQGTTDYPNWPYANYAGTFTTFPDKTWITYNPFEGQQGVPYDVPVLHCEIEGERLHLVCEAISFFDGFGTGVCEATFLGIPVGQAICWLINFVMAPMITAALTTAWIAGSDDNRDFDDAGSLSMGDGVVITGRWVYDAGHHGQNELHAVTSVQKLDPAGMTNPDTLADLRDQWCRHVSEVPPPRGPGAPAGPGGQPAALTSDQLTVYTNQIKPENRWIFHPLLDGCEPSEPPPPIT